jgi:hypothetical protein
LTVEVLVYVEMEYAAMMYKLKQFSISAGKVYNSIRKNGVKNTLLTIKGRFDAKYSTNIKISQEETDLMNGVYKSLNDLILGKKLKGLVVITSAMEFEEVYNQRTINLAKYYSENDYAVLYVVWQWQSSEKLEKSYQNVYENIYQVPLYPFIATIPALNALEFKGENSFFVTFPAKAFLNMFPTFHQMGYKVVYDIMDEWEEFYKVGHAPWYNMKVEEEITKQAGLVFAVSKPLSDKFNYIREDIYVVGNGFSEKLSGEKDIALKTPAEDGRIHTGYFGHLTDSWLDWDILIEMIKEDKFFIHLIGYGIPERLEKELKNYENVRYYGKVHPSELAAHVKNWHVGLIPFKKSALSQAVDPIKIYEYLYFGLPTVSSGIPHIGAYPHVTHADHSGEFKAAVEKAYQQLMTDADKNADLEAFLAKSTWEKRFEFIEDKLLD